MGKFKREHFKRKNVTWNEASKRVLNKKEWAKFVHK